MQKIAQIINNNDFETTIIFKKLSNTNRYLGELKGLCKNMPNQSILLNTLAL